MRGLLIMYMACPAGELGIAPPTQGLEDSGTQNADWQAVTGNL